MPRFNVQNCSGEWACFSSIVDDFITDFMPREEYQKWREKEYGANCGEIGQANIMDYKEALRTILCKKVPCNNWDLPSKCDSCEYWRNRKCTVVENYKE